MMMLSRRLLFVLFTLTVHVLQPLLHGVEEVGNLHDNKRAAAPAHLINSSTNLSSLNQAAIKNITLQQIANFAQSNIQSLTAIQIPFFTPAQVAAFPIEGIKFFKVGPGNQNQIAAFTPAQVKVFTTNQIAALTTAQIAVLTVKQIKALSLEQVAALTMNQVAALTSAQIAAMTPAQVGALTTNSAGLASALTTVSSKVNALAAGFPAAKAGFLYSYGFLTGSTPTMIFTSPLNKSGSLANATLTSLEIAGFGPIPGTVAVRVTGSGLANNGSYGSANVDVEAGEVNISGILYGYASSTTKFEGFIDFNA